VPLLADLISDRVMFAYSKGFTLGAWEKQAKNPTE
jgi:hypothetical protein